MYTSTIIPSFLYVSSTTDCFESSDFKWLVLECTIGFISYYLLFKNFWDCWIAVFCLNYIDVCYCVVYTGWAKKK